MDSQVAQVRRFNRTVTQRVGALSDDFLSRSRPLAMSRLLWEIGTEGGEVVMLRARLGVDSGQMSRMLRALEADGLVRVTPSDADGRVRVARLTEKGLAERAVLDERSDELAASILEPLGDGERAELAEAMRTVERLITASMVEIRGVDPEDPDAQRCLRAYVAELNRRAPDRGFDPSKGSTAEPHEVRWPVGAFVVVYLRGEPVGCGAVKHHPGEVPTSSGCGSPSRPAGSASAAGCSSTWRASRASAARARSGSRPATCWARRSRCTARPATPRCRRSMTSRLRTGGSRSRSRL